MTDIVEHLRMACNEYGYCAGSLAGDAADEIERLRAERDALKAELNQFADNPHPEPLQGGMSNDELVEAFQTKVPGVTPTEDQLTAFALGVEVGNVGARTYFAERNSARDAWRRRYKECEELRAERDALRADAERYRWLRDKRLGQHIAYAIRGQNEERDLYDVEADAAIDAARKA